MSRVDDILRERRHQSSNMAEIRAINDFVQNLVLAAYSDAQECEYEDQVWEHVYDAVFSPSVSQRVMRLADDFDWADPDASYREDVDAFASALDRYCD